MEKLVIIGYGGHAKSVVDTIRSKGQYEIVGYTDVEDRKEVGLEYLGRDEVLPDLYQSGVLFAFLGLGYMGKSDIRMRLYEFAKKIGYSFPVIIDPSAIIAHDVEIREGTFIGKRAVVNTGSRVGNNCIINTGAIIEHENVIGDFTHVAVGAVLCGNVSVGSQCLIGANSTVLQGLTIGNNTIIGGGSIVLRDVKSNVTRYGKIGGGISGLAVVYKLFRSKAYNR